MASSMIVEIIKSVTKATLTSAMIFICVVRIAMLAYPSVPVEVQYSATYSSPETANVPVSESRIVTPETKRRIVLGKNSIENLGKAQ